MRVAVVGAGGIGSVFGGRLAAGGHDVWLVHRRREVVEALRRDGLRLESSDGEEHIAVQANETAAVAQALGVALPYTDPAARVRQHCQDVGASKPSMLQDMERGRPTEIDAINGAVVRAGARLGVPTPYNQALLLLVKARQEVSGRPV